jgi:archaellum component FlaC
MTDEKLKFLNDVKEQIKRTEISISAMEIALQEAEEELPGLRAKLASLKAQYEAG